MFCRKCGSQISDEVKFCPKCGAAISGAGEETWQQEVPPIEMMNVNTGSYMPKLLKVFLILMVMFVVFVILACGLLLLAKVHH